MLFSDWQIKTSSNQTRSLKYHLIVSVNKRQEWEWWLRCKINIPFICYYVERHMDVACQCPRTSVSSWGEWPAVTCSCPLAAVVSAEHHIADVFTLCTLQTALMQRGFRRNIPRSSSSRCHDDISPPSSQLCRFSWELKALQNKLSVSIMLFSSLWQPQRGAWVTRKSSSPHIFFFFFLIPLLLRPEKFLTRRFWWISRFRGVCFLWNKNTAADRPSFSN